MNISDAHMLIGAYLREFPNKPPSGLSPEAFRAFVNGRRLGMIALITGLSSVTEGLLVPVRNGGHWGITKEARPDGAEWRITRFDRDMVPLGHEAHSTAAAALEDVILWADVTRLPLSPKMPTSATAEARRVAAMPSLVRP